MFEKQFKYRFVNICVFMRGYRLAMFCAASINKALLCVEPLGVPSVYRVGETQPVNVAAHLRLLGEDLYYIGNKIFSFSHGWITATGPMYFVFCRL